MSIQVERWFVSRPPRRYLNCSCDSRRRQSLRFNRCGSCWRVKIWLRSGRCLFGSWRSRYPAGRLGRLCCRAREGKVLRHGSVCILRVRLALPLPRAALSPSPAQDVCHLRLILLLLSIR